MTGARTLEASLSGGSWGCPLSSLESLKPSASLRPCSGRERKLGRFILKLFEL